jgi:hypothetical protein
MLRRSKSQDVSTSSGVWNVFDVELEDMRMWKSGHA